MANAIKMLQDDHNSVRILFGQVQQVPAGQGDMEEKAALQIASLLKTHDALEEEYIYPVLAEFEPGLAEDSKTDHAEVKRLLGHIEKMPEGMKLRDVLDQLQTSVQAHVEKEENEVFPLLTEKLGVSKLEDLGLVMMTRQQELLQANDDITGAAETGRPQNIYPKM